MASPMYRGNLFTSHPNGPGYLPGLTASPARATRTQSQAATNRTSAAGHSRREGANATMLYGPSGRGAILVLFKERARPSLPSSARSRITVCLQPRLGAHHQLGAPSAGGDAPMRGDP